MVFKSIIPPAGFAVLNGAQTFHGAQTVAPVPLFDIDGGVATDASLSNNFTYILTRDSFLSAPTNLVTGTYYSWHFTQDSSGFWALTFDSIFWFANATPMVITTAPDSLDSLTGYYDGNILRCSFLQAFGNGM